MRLPSTTKAESSIGVPPSPVISRAPSNTVTFCAAAGDRVAAIASRARASVWTHDGNRRRMKSSRSMARLFFPRDHIEADTERLAPVSRFRSSHHLVAYSSANFGIEGHQDAGF